MGCVALELTPSVRGRGKAKLDGGSWTCVKGVGRVAVLNRAVFGRITFDKELEGGEEVSCAAIW